MDEKLYSSPTAESIFKEHDKSVGFKSQIKLYETVEENENFFIGKQWEGVENNGLPTPIFNFLKRVVLFQVASILSENIKMQAAPLALAPNQKYVEQLAEVVSNEFEALFEYNKIGSLLREYMRNAAVDGDSCLYTYWDDGVNTGRPVKGAIVTEVIENIRVHFGNPNERRVQSQPHIIIERREMVRAVKRRAKANGVPASSIEMIQSDSDTRNSASRLTDDHVTVLLRMWRDDDTGEIMACESVKNVIIRKSWGLGVKLYPITWLNWDYVQDCYHGQAMITGLIPNQKFVNKTYAMVQMSLMMSAFPKIVYDKNRIVGKWSNQVGAAIPVNGDVNNIAKVLEPAQVSPQISQFIDSTIEYTQTFLGATSAAMGDTRPDNTSAIIALQRASAIPSEITKQNLYMSVEELGQIYMEFMIAYYGTRTVKAPKPDLTGLPIQMPDGIADETMEFDFGTLKDIPMSLKLDVGASSYWSEIASMQTLDNLLMQGQIQLEDYLERVPSGYISKKQELIEKIKREKAMALTGQPPGGAMPEEAPEIPLTAGNSALQRAVVQGAPVA